MTLKFLSALFLITAALLLTGVVSGHAQVGVYVLESTTPDIKVGTSYALNDRLTIPSGTSVRVMMPSGKTQTVKGPYSGAVADLTKGDNANESVIAWIKNLLQTGGSNERTPGATRSTRLPSPPASFSWTSIPVTVDSTICVQKGASLQLLRAHSQNADRIAVVDETTSQRANVDFAPGSETAPWPSELMPGADASYTLLGSGNRPRRLVHLRVLDRLPGEDDVLAALAQRGCKSQFEAWVREKIAAGRRKAS